MCIRDSLRSVRHRRVRCKGIQNSVYYNLINGAEIKRENHFPYFIARCNTEEQIKAVSKLKFDRVEIYDPKMYEYALEYFDETSVYLSLPVIISEDDLEIVEMCIRDRQKAVIVLLALLYLGVKNIHLGPTLPAFLSPNVAKVLVENFGIAGITTVDEDIKILI